MSRRSRPYYTSSEVLRMDITELADLVAESSPFLYRPTTDEWGALDWDLTVLTAGGCRYLVAEELLGSEKRLRGQRVLAIEPWDISIALAKEGVDRVPCLSDDTALQRIVWVIGPDEEYEDEDEDEE